MGVHLNIRSDNRHSKVAAMVSCICGEATGNKGVVCGHSKVVTMSLYSSTAVVGVHLNIRSDDRHSEVAAML